MPVRDSKGFLLSIVVPCFNEEDNVHAILDAVKAVLTDYADYELIFVDDGSRDLTLDRIKAMAQVNPCVKFISFSRNFGQQNALKAGIDKACGDCIITMDGDMQHPPTLIPKMIDLWLAGYDVVYTVRDDSQNRWSGKWLTSLLFYKFFNKAANISLDYGAADFRLIDASVASVISGMRESNPFLRGLISWAGFKQMRLMYRPQQRASGSSKYSAAKMVELAITGYASFGISPLRVSFFLGLICSVLSFIYGIYSLIQHIFSNATVPGWTSLIASILFLSGIQFIILGVIGEYVGKIFLEVKRRPSYIISESNLQLHVSSKETVRV